MKIITVCGSYRFKKEMVEITEKLALQGNCIVRRRIEIGINCILNFRLLPT